MAISCLIVGASERRRFLHLASLDAVLCRSSLQPPGRSSLYSAGTDGGSAADCLHVQPAETAELPKQARRKQGAARLDWQDVPLVEPRRQATASARGTPATCDARGASYTQNVDTADFVDQLYLTIKLTIRSIAASRKETLLHWC